MTKGDGDDICDFSSLLNSSSPPNVSVEYVEYKSTPVYDYCLGLEPELSRFIYQKKHCFEGGSQDLKTALHQVPSSYFDGVTTISVTNVAKLEALSNKLQKYVELVENAISTTLNNQKNFPSHNVASLSDLRLTISPSLKTIGAMRSKIKDELLQIQETWTPLQSIIRKKENLRLAATCVETLRSLDLLYTKNGQQTCLESCKLLRLIIEASQDNDLIADSNIGKIIIARNLEFMNKVDEALPLEIASLLCRISLHGRPCEIISRVSSSPEARNSSIFLDSHPFRDLNIDKSIEELIISELPVILGYHKLKLDVSIECLPLYSRWYSIESNFSLTPVRECFVKSFKKELRVKSLEQLALLMSSPEDDATTTTTTTTLSRSRSPPLTQVVASISDETFYNFLCRMAGWTIRVVAAFYDLYTWHSRPPLIKSIIQASKILHETREKAIEHHLAEDELETKRFTIFSSLELAISILVQGMADTTLSFSNILDHAMESAIRHMSALIRVRAGVSDVTNLTMAYWIFIEMFSELERIESSCSEELRRGLGLAVKIMEDKTNEAMDLISLKLRQASPAKRYTIPVKTRIVLRGAKESRTSLIHVLRTLMSTACDLKWERELERLRESLDSCRTSKELGVYRPIPENIRFFIFGNLVLPSAWEPKSTAPELVLKFLSSSDVYQGSNDNLLPNYTHEGPPLSSRMKKFIGLDSSNFHVESLDIFGLMIVEFLCHLFKCPPLQVKIASNIQDICNSVPKLLSEAATKGCKMVSQVAIGLATTKLLFELIERIENIIKIIHFPSSNEISLTPAFASLQQIEENLTDKLANVMCVKFDKFVPGWLANISKSCGSLDETLKCLGGSLSSDKAVETMSKLSHSNTRLQPLLKDLKTFISQTRLHLTSEENDLVLVKVGNHIMSEMLVSSTISPPPPPPPPLLLSSSAGSKDGGDLLDLLDAVLATTDGGASRNKDVSEFSFRVMVILDIQGISQAIEARSFQSILEKTVERLQF